MACMSYYMQELKIGLVAQVFKFTIHKIPGNGGGEGYSKN